VRGRGLFRCRLVLAIVDPAAGAGAVRVRGVRSEPGRRMRKRRGKGSRASNEALDIVEIAA